MTIRYAVLGAAAGLTLLTGCGSTASGPDAPSDTVGVTVTVHTHLAPGKNGEMFTEGAVPEIRLVDADGHATSPVRDHEDVAVFRGVPAGHYRLEAALRPCDGNCGQLDGPTARCTRSVRVSHDDTFVVRWRVGEACRVVRG